MIRYVKLKNYRSLVDLYVDLTNKRGTPKKLVLVYGENGVGKSNFAYAFYTLSEILRTKSVKDIVEHILEENAEERNYEEDLSLKKFIRERFKDIEGIIKESKTIGSFGENMVLEFGIKIDGRNGVYRLETDDRQIVYERLEYIISKEKKVFYEITQDKVVLDENLVKREEYLEELENLINQYWGKHSLLSLLVSENEDKKEGYVEERISKYLYKVMAYFMTMSIRLKASLSVEKGKMGISHPILARLDEGTLSVEKEVELDKAESFLNEFFTHLYSDVKQVYYDRELEDSKIKYRLIFKKKIYDKLIDIGFKEESTGTQYLLQMLPFFMASVEGRTSIVDEMDTGIHDVLIDTILENLYESIEGQMIITTHNTMLLESDLPKDSIYVFDVDNCSRKELLPINSFEKRIHPNLNVRKRYLQGMYGGVPIPMSVDFEELLEIIE